VTGLLGLDVGGVSTKAAWLPGAPGRGRGSAPDLAGLVTARRYLEVWRDPEALSRRLADLAAALPPARAAAVTMTAELSDVFRTKAEGVRRVLAAVREAFPDVPVAVLDVDGRLLETRDVAGREEAVAAANWVATARLVGAWVPDAILVDVGSTTTDVIPVAAGRPAARGRDDTSRLAEGELVYTGALRTPVFAVAPTLPVGGRPTRTAPEHFALVADAHLVLGDLAPEAYSCPTADGRPTALPYAAERLARAVCADAARLGEAGVRVLAAAVSERQVAAIAEALLQVLSGRPSALAHPVVTAGVGAWLARRAAARLGLEARDLEALVGAEGSAVAPSVALAWLARRHWPQEA
jgi:(4-(4-[2-(gamma-L-glutamylamino)ethyl]phenoxymethyl)furan-2-yl)methanamine synthase